MQSVVIPVTLYLLFYAPGHYLLRGQPGGGGRDSRLFREVLLSCCCTSWLGFVLAECGAYSLPTLLGCVAAASAAAGGFTRRARPAPYRLVDLVGLGVALATWLWVAPPLDTRILGSDSAGYLASGIYLSRHGSLIIHDPTMPLLSADLKRSLFHSVTPNPGAPPFLRLAGSFVLRSLDADEVLPAFHHLIAVWIAVFHGLGGSQAAPWAITLFAGLSSWALVEFAMHLGGGLVAFVSAVLLSLASPQYWYSRFLMPEVPAQYFVWGGLCCVSLWCRSQRRSDALLAGIAFGIAGLMRIENAAFLLITLAAALYFAGGDSPRHRFLLLGGASILWLHAAVHLVVFRTHYIGNLRTFLPETFAPLAQAAPLHVALLILGATSFALWLRFRRSGWSGSSRLLFAVALAASLAFWGDWRNRWSSLTLLTAYVGIPTCILGGIGLALRARNMARRELAEQMFVVLAVLAFAQVMLAPHATPVPIWIVRRFVTIVLPGFCLALALLCGDITERWRWPGALPLLALAFVGQLSALRDLRSEPYYRGGLRHVRTLEAMLPADACLLFDSGLAGWGFAQALWAERDIPSFFLSPYDVPHISTLLRSLDGRSLYWVSDGKSAPPQVPGAVVTPAAFYEFTLPTPGLGVRSVPLARTRWDGTIAVYSLHLLEHPEAGSPGGTSAP